MSIEDTKSDHGHILRRIAAGNRRVESGAGFGLNHFVPVCTVTNRSLAATFKQRLIEENIQVNIRRERLCVRFFVHRESLTGALRVRDMLLAKHPDTVPRKFSRDYDSVFLLTPLTLFAAFITYIAPWISNDAWIGVLTSGASVMIFLERMNRQYRKHVGSQWGIQELLWGTAVAAINVAVWQSVL